MTSERVVTMEFVPGVKINNLDEIDRRGIDRKLLAKRSAEAYLTQLCRHGFFHCDPHPGVLFVFFFCLFWLAWLFCTIIFEYGLSIFLSVTVQKIMFFFALTLTSVAVVVTVVVVVAITLLLQGQAQTRLPTQQSAFRGPVLPSP